MKNSSRPLLLFPLLLVLGLNAAADESSLLFYLSGNYGTTADFSASQMVEPNFVSGITSIDDGAKGVGLQCANDQLLAYEAAGNIFAQRGTLSFFWRSRYPVGPTEFPIFRVGYADHSSWDMVWLRIDYNGHGFDAFVTDANLARTRVSVTVDPFPQPDEWVHLTLSWDETRGIRFYVNGQTAATVETQARYDAGLDQFGPHSRIISPYQVQSDYNFQRGGDIDEVRIHDRMLEDGAVVKLASGDELNELGSLSPRDLADTNWRDEWWFRYGWNRPNDPPPSLDSAATTIRKVEIHDVYDLKRWWWKGNDGIRETTWPGVYNRSRLPGRLDYFVLPDWDCYSLSGKSVTFTMPDEPWNHIEISGAAWGDMTYNDGDKLFERPAQQEKTFHRLPSDLRSGQMVFTNEKQETAIGELAAYHVKAGKEPKGYGKLTYRLTNTTPDNPALENLVDFISGRHPLDERTFMVAQPEVGASRGDISNDASESALPLVHILIPNDHRDASLAPRPKSYTWDSINAGLDGIAIDLPPLDLPPTHGELIPFNIQVKDPLWPARNLLDFTFSIRPGNAHTLWLDLRDRILPPGKSLYLTIASASGAFGADDLNGSEIRLVFKPRAEAIAEHTIDRFTQVRDNYAMLVEEHANHRKLKLYARLERDLTDLLRIEPDHLPGRYYWTQINPEQPAPKFAHAQPPEGVPLWAFRQVEVLKRLREFVTWYIDHRQIENGEFGGGLSDDTDMTNHWPATALMGVAPDKVTESLRRVLEACYEQGLFTNGLATIQADELHSYEEGINALSQILLLDHGSPKQLERAMETTRAVNGVTGINTAGHRHFRSVYYGGTKLAEEEPWGWSKYYSYLVLHPGYLLVEYNGNPTAKNVITELASGLLAHRYENSQSSYRLPTAIRFHDDAEGSSTRGSFPWELFWSSWKWTGDDRYLIPIEDRGAASLLRINANALDLLGRRDDWGATILNSVYGRKTINPGPYRNRNYTDQHIAWQVSGDKQHLSKSYTEQIEAAEIMKYTNTEGSLWIDRVGVPYRELQRARLGGVALVRGSTFPGHAVSWKFDEPATAESVAILIPDANKESLTVIAYNLETNPVSATMTGWGVEPGTWEISTGTDTNDDDRADVETETRTVSFGRDEDIQLTFPPRVTTIVKLRRTEPGKPYWSRPDLGIGNEDVEIRDNELKITVHSLGSVATPVSRLVVRGNDGRIAGSVAIPALPAPVDLLPQRADVIVRLRAGFQHEGATVEIDPDERLTEITRRNNSVQL